MKEKHLAWKAVFFMAVVLVIVFAYLLGIIPVKYYKCFIFPNAGVSAVAVNIVPEFNGSPVHCDEMIVTDASAPPDKKGEVIRVSRFNAGFVRFVRAKRLNLLPESASQSNQHTYVVSYKARNFVVTVIDTRDSLIGTAAFSILPNKPFVVKTVRVRMRKTKFSKGNYGILNVLGISRAAIEESKTVYGSVNLVRIRSTKNEASRIYVPLGATFYVCAESRFDSAEPLSEKWARSGSCAIQALNFSSVTGGVENGVCRNLSGYAEYVYIREKIVLRKLFGTYITYSETVFPVSLSGCASGDISSESPPSSVSGEIISIGDGNGTSTSVELKGKPGIYWDTPKPLVVKASFNGGNETETLNVPVCSEKHYDQHVRLKITGISPQPDGVIQCFDKNTNWGDVYFMFQKYEN